MNSTKIQRAANLNNDTIDQILAILDGWSEKLTWNKLIDEIEVQTSHRYTRQALSKHSDIKYKFQTIKENITELEYKHPTLNTEDMITIQKIKRLEAENQRLNDENQELLMQFIRWSYNAKEHGLDIEILDKPLKDLER